MMLLDANLLLYAYDSLSPFHLRAKTWAQQVMAKKEHIGLAWIAILAFLRVSTQPRAQRLPSLADAISAMEDWLEHPSVSIVNPGERHWEILRKLLPDSQARGPLVMDAHLAALAIEHGATLCTNDKDFTRFRGLKILNPLEG